MSRKKTERVGETGFNKQGYKMKIVEYHDNKNVIVRFLNTGVDKRTTYRRFKSGNVKTNVVVEHDCSISWARVLAAVATISILSFIFTVLS